jgi:anti-sigma B factor antagonist
MSFSYKSENVNGIVKLMLSGRLMEKSQATDLLNEVDTYIKNNMNKFIIHLGNIEYMNSSGLNVTVNILTKARNAGGEVVVSNVSKKIQELFIITKLNTLFTICDTIEEAEKYLNK